MSKLDLISIVDFEKSMKSLVELNVDHEITLKILEFILSSIEKVKPGFYIPYCLCFLNQTGQNANLTAFTSKILVFCRPEWTKGGPHVNDI